MATSTNSKATTDHDWESYLRWQDTAITQLGYTINLVLTLAGAALGFAVKTMMESKEVLPHLPRLLFHSSVWLLSISILAAVAANFTRCHDFRLSRRAARARVEGNIAIHSSCTAISKRLGGWTWTFFSVQSASFAIGVVMFSRAIWLGYGNKI
jgi:hypothetical protein